MKEICGFKCRIVRRRQNTIRMTVGQGGTLSIYAPPKVSLNAIAAIVERNSQKLREALRRNVFALDSELFGNSSGESRLYCLGSSCPVVFSNERAPGFADGRFTLPPELTANEYRKIISKVYRRLATEYITPLTEELSRLSGLEYEHLRFTSATSRWGSCSSRKTVCFSSYLMIAPPKCIRLVVCHELTHLKEMNHSARFYQKLSELVPDHRELTARLKRDYGKLLRSFKTTAEP